MSFLHNKSDNAACVLRRSFSDVAAAAALESGSQANQATQSSSGMEIASDARSVCSTLTSSSIQSLYWESSSYVSSSSCTSESSESFTSTESDVSSLEPGELPRVIEYPTGGGLFDLLTESDLLEDVISYDGEPPQEFLEHEVIPSRHTPEPERVVIERDIEPLNRRVYTKKPSGRVRFLGAIRAIPKSLGKKKTFADVGVQADLPTYFEETVDFLTDKIVGLEKSVYDLKQEVSEEKKKFECLEQEQSWAKKRLLTTLIDIEQIAIAKREAEDSKNKMASVVNKLQNENEQLHNMKLERELVVLDSLRQKRDFHAVSVGSSMTDIALLACDDIHQVKLDLKSSHTALKYKFKELFNIEPEDQIKLDLGIIHTDLNRLFDTEQTAENRFPEIEVVIEDLFQSGYLLPKNVQLVAIAHVGTQLEDWKTKLARDVSPGKLLSDIDVEGAENQLPDDTSSSPDNVKTEVLSPKKSIPVPQIIEVIPETKADTWPMSGEDHALPLPPLYSSDDDAGDLPIEPEPEPDDTYDPAKEDHLVVKKSNKSKKRKTTKRKCNKPPKRKCVKKTSKSKLDSVENKDNDQENEDRIHDSDANDQNIEDSDNEEGAKKPRKSPKRPFTPRECPLCFKVFVSNSGYRYHKSMHAKARLPCPRCPYVDYHQARLDTHMAQKHFTLTETSEKDKATSELMSFKQKLSEQVGPGTISCEICKKSFLHRSGLVSHMKFHLSGPLTCPHCEKEFHSKSGLKSHMKLHTGEALQCAQCKFTCGTKGGMNAHMRRVHIKLKNFLCDICAKGFVTSSILQKHKQAAHTNLEDQVTYPCPHCDHRAKSESNLKCHVRNIHTDNPGFVCNLCGAVLKYKQSLIDHQQRHVDMQKQHACGQCNFLAGTRTDLKRHITRTHRIPDIKCEFCGKLFKQKHHLQRHHTIHTGEKAFSCTLCKYVCNVKGNLSKHMAQVHKKVIRERPVIEKLVAGEAPPELKPDAISSTQQATIVIQPTITTLQNAPPQDMNNEIATAVSHVLDGSQFYGQPKLMEAVAPVLFL